MKNRMNLWIKALSLIVLLSLALPGAATAAPGYGEEPTPVPTEGIEVEPFSNGVPELEPPPGGAATPAPQVEFASADPAQVQAGVQAAPRIPYPWSFENPLRFMEAAGAGADAQSGASALPQAKVDSQGLELLSQYGGIAYAAAVQQDYAYLLIGSRLVILDVSDPEAVAVVGKTPQWSFNTVAVAVSGNYAYVMGDDGNGLRVVDVSNAAAPKEVGAYASVFGYDLKISGTDVFVAESACLKIIDAAQPAAPALASVYCPPLTGGDSLGFYTTGVAIAGKYAFYAAGPLGLHIVDVLVPEAPQLVGVFQHTGNLSSVAVSADGDFAVLADSGEYDADSKMTINSGLRIVDVSDPAHPTAVGFAGSKAVAAKVALSGSLALLATGNDYDSQGETISETGMEVFDISNPSSPSFTSIYPLEGTQPFDLTSAEGKAYLVDNGYGLRIIDVSAPETPKKVGGYPAAVPLDVFRAGNYAYLASGYAGLQIIDFSNPAAPLLAGALDTGGYTRDVVVSGNTAYLAEGDDGGGTIDPTNIGLLSVDVTTPAAPVTKDFLQQESEPNRIALQGNTVFLTMGDNGSGRVSPAGMGLKLFDVSDPGNMVERGFLMTHGNPNGLAVAANANTAYVASGMYYAAGEANVTGMDVISTADKQNPTSLAFFDTPGLAYDVALAGDFAYVADGPVSGLRIVDVSNPAAPVHAGVYVSGGASFGVAAAENRAYLADGWNGMQIINVADPSKAHLEAFYVSGTAAFEGGVALADSKIFGAAGMGGLFALQYGTSATYSIAGKVTDQNNGPVADVTISAGASHTTKTNASGEYKLENLPAGTYTVTPSTDLIGVTFEPINRVGSLPPSATGVDFKQIPLTSCPNLIKNGDFEKDSDWYLPVTVYPAGFSNDLIQAAAAAYSTEEVYAGQRSLRVGIVDPAKNVFSYSSGWQQVSIPANVTSATLRFYLYPLSVNGIDGGDVQLMIVLNNAKTEVQRPVNVQSNSKTWTPYSFDMKKYAGKTIWVYFGVVNNGYAANMAMYVDNVSLEACTP